MMLSAHQFALYTPLLSQIASAGSLADIHELTELELVHRISSVLRLVKGDSLILFDSSYHSTATILGIQPKKSVTVELHSLEPNIPLTPHITWVVPLLKREHFEEALYTLVELGAQVIQPVLTRKIHKAWWSEKEVLRAQKIMIAASEQSKQFILPTLMPLLPFEVWVTKSYDARAAKIFFDPQGEPLTTVIASLHTLQPHELIGCVGPEGDLTAQEKEMLMQQGFQFCRLTKTILRAQEAITVGLGALRSLL